MNENENNGTVNAVETKQRGRKRDENRLRPVFLNEDGTVRGKGARPVGKTIRAAFVQTSVKNSEFNINTTPIHHFEDVVVPARNYKPKANVTVNTATQNETVEPTPVETVGNPVNA